VTGPGVRRQLCGVRAVSSALASGEAIRLILVSNAPKDSSIPDLLRRAEAAGVRVRVTSEASLWRLSKTEPAAEILGLQGSDPEQGRDEVLAAGGAAWLLVNVAYPGNTGFAIRCAEVSGADACFVDNPMLHEGKREALRASMRADRFMPVFWESAGSLLPAARAAGRRIFAVEDVGSAQPWEVDLCVPALFIVGGEKHGIPEPILRESDTVLRLPMHGFIPSYNLQAAMAMVMGERLRQCAALAR